MKSWQMLRGVGREAALLVRRAPQFCERARERVRVAIREGDSAGTDRLRQTSAARPDDDATTGNPLQRHDPDRFPIPQGKTEEFGALEKANQPGVPPRPAQGSTGSIGKGGATCAARRALPMAKASRTAPRPPATRNAAPSRGRQGDARCRCSWRTRTTRAKSVSFALRLPR